MGSFGHRMADIANITNLAAADPFAETEDLPGGKAQGYVHIRIQQRNGRKSITTVAGLNEELDLKKILRALKKEFSCNGTVLEDEQDGSVLQMQGDQRNNVAKFLTEQGIVAKSNVKVHGF